MDFIAQISSEVHALHAFDLLTVGTLALLEGILSVDNALVLAILVRTLPQEQRRKALTYGIVGAFVFRFIALLFAGHLMQLLIFKLLGGGYLLYLAMKHMFFSHGGDALHDQTASAHNFWYTVLMVELTDIAFSIDSITTAVAMSDKLVVVWIGGILGIIALRFAASAFVRLLEFLPKLEELAYQLIFFIGIKLILDGFGFRLDHSIFWLMMAIIAVLGGSLVYRDYRTRAAHSALRDQLMAQFRAGQLSIDDLLALETIPAEIIQALHAEGRLLFDPVERDSLPPQ